MMSLIGNGVVVGREKIGLRLFYRRLDPTANRRSSHQLWFVPDNPYRSSVVPTISVRQVGFRVVVRRPSIQY